MSKVHETLRIFFLFSAGRRDTGLLTCMLESQGATSGLPLRNEKAYVKRHDKRKVEFPRPQGWTFVGVGTIKLEARRRVTQNLRQQAALFCAFPGFGIPNLAGTVEAASFSLLNDPS